MTVRDELIARLAARLSRAEHVESISAEIPVADLRAVIIALATAPPTDQSRHGGHDMTARDEMIEQARRLYRTLEMSANIMRDPRRTGGWAGAERTASAFDRAADHARDIHTALATAPPNVGELVEVLGKIVSGWETCSRFAYVDEARMQRDHAQQIRFALTKFQGGAK